MMWPYPKVIVHRLGGALGPENTLAGLAITAKLGFKAVEFDVMLSHDGVPLVMHDETLERTTNGIGKVADRDARELLQLDAGGKRHAAFAGEKIPTFVEVLVACQHFGIVPNVEIKPAMGFDADTARAVVEAITQHWREVVPPLLSSFSVAAMEVVQELAPHLPRALNVVEVPSDWQRQIAALGCTGLHPSLRDNDLSVLRACRSEGVQMAVWTVNERAQAENLFAIGIDAVFSDRPDLFVAG